MKRPFKRNISEESYWKSFTDILAGLLLVILLVLMLLLLLLTQMNDEEHKYDYQYETYNINDDINDDNGENNNESNHFKDNDHDNVSDGGGGGGGGGEDDPGTETDIGPYVDIGHDKTAVFVTVIDEETGNVIKQEGILFELYANRNNGGLMTLHTYYPEKIEYKQYETTEAGTFYLPEKITKGIYSLHNLKPPKGYGLAEDVKFTIDESRDWSEPFLVDVPMSPAKSIIYIHSVDTDTNIDVGGCTYEVYAAEDIITLDGTVRYHSGEKVDEFICDDHGKGQSIKLYLGKYTVVQKIPAAYYALANTPVNVTLDITESGEAPTYTVKCEKTKAVFILTDEFDGKPIKGAVYTVPGREPAITDEDGKITVTDLDKSAAYTVTLDSVPEPYRISAKPVTFHVDGSGYIDGKTRFEVPQTAYIIRLIVDIKDIIYKNSVTGNTARLYDDSNVLVDDWEASGSEHLITGLEPGLYTLEVDGSSPITVEVKDNGETQSVSTTVWTIWDTISVALAVVLFAAIIFIAVRVINRLRKKKKANG